MSGPLENRKLIDKVADALDLALGAGLPSERCAVAAIDAVLDYLQYGEKE